MVNGPFTIVPLWSDLARSRSPLRRRSAFARGRALPAAAGFPPAPGSSREQCFQGAPFMTCGRGGTGRRAALRSLWGKLRGSSSLLDRTIGLTAGFISLIHHAYREWLGMRALAIGFLSLALASTSAAAQMVGGQYRVEGTNADGSAYRGTATITPSSDSTCRISWQTGSTSSGICML